MADPIQGPGAHARKPLDVSAAGQANGQDPNTEMIVADWGSGTSSQVPDAHGISGTTYCSVTRCDMPPCDGPSDPNQVVAWESMSLGSGGAHQGGIAGLNPGGLSSLKLFHYPSDSSGLKKQ